MAFPATLEDLSTTRASSGDDKLNEPDHLTHHEAEDTLTEAIQAKVGVDNSAVVTSLDYLLKNSASINPGHKHNFLSALDGVPAQSVYVDSAGNVGIGLTDPRYDLAIGEDVDFGTPISGTAFVSIAKSNAPSTLTLGQSSTNNVILGWSYNLAPANAYAYLGTDSGNNPLVLQNFGGNVAIGAGLTGPQAKLHVDQSSTTAAIPVLYLDQADLSEEMIEFNTTIGVGNPIEAIGFKRLTTTHFIRVTLPGALTRYIPCGTIA